MAHRRERNASSIDGDDSGGTERRKEKNKKNKKRKGGKTDSAGNWELNVDVNRSCTRGQARSGY
jgi:hypothetical protein